MLWGYGSSHLLCITSVHFIIIPFIFNLKTGNIYKFDAYDHQLEDCLLTQKSRLETVSRRVGRLLCVYENDQRWGGTGFLVSDNTIVTARHVVKPRHGDLKLLSIYFTLRVYAPSSTLKPPKSDIYELELMPDFVVNMSEYQRYHLCSGGFTTEYEDDENIWEIQNDFAFLKFKV